MATGVVVRRDDVSLYVRHGNDVFRPIVNKEHEHTLGGEDGEALRQRITEVWRKKHGWRFFHIAWHGITLFEEGSRVKKWHVSQTTYAIISQPDIHTREMWFWHKGKDDG